MTKYVSILATIILAGVSAQARVVDRIVAQVNDDIITLSDMNREMADIRRELASRYSGDQLEQEIKKAEKDVLEELIRQKLILQKANEYGFGANVDAQVSAALQRIMKDNGLKDIPDLERALERQGMTLASFRDRLKKSMISQGLIQEFVGSRITLLTQEIEKYYKEHTTDYTVPEELCLSEIIIPADEGEAAMARANDIAKRISQGESFATLASQYSKGPTAGKGGNIGCYITDKLNPEIAKAVASAKEGEITPVLTAKEGYTIYHVDSRRPQAVKPLEEVRDEIRNRLWQAKFNPEYERFVAQLKEEAYIQIFSDTPTQ